MQQKTFLNIRSVWVIVPIVGILVFLCLYLLATLFYPGGTELSPLRSGFSWSQNYWCNLLNVTAINGEPNTARPFALSGMVVLMITLGLFWYVFPSFTNFSSIVKRLIQCSGFLSMFSITFLSSAYHDLTLNVSGLFGLVALIGTIAGLREMKLNQLFYFGMFNLVLVIVNNILYFGHDLKHCLPIVQKFTFLFFLTWIASICIIMYGRMKRARSQP